MIGPGIKRITKRMFGWWVREGDPKSMTQREKEGKVPWSTVLLQTDTLECPLDMTMPIGSFVLCCILVHLISRKYCSESSLSTLMLFQALSLPTPSLLNHCLLLILASKYGLFFGVRSLKRQWPVWTGISRFMRGEPNMDRKHKHLFRKFTLSPPCPTLPPI